MHRQIEITVPPEHTDPLLDRLKGMKDIIALSVSRSASIKPPGDVVQIQALNRGCDEVMRAVATLSKNAHVIASTSDLASITDNQEQEAIENDTDNELWEEVETGLRQSTHITYNYALLMGLGGMVSATALATRDIEMGIAFVSASIIAPGFEPLAKILMGVVLKSKAVAVRALWSFLAGYGVLVAAAAITFAALRMTGVVIASEVAVNPELNAVMSNAAPQNIISFCGALAGMIMLTSHREETIAGAIMALELIPAAALIAAGAVSFHSDLFWLGAMRFAIDIVFVLGIAATFIWIKQRAVHKRRAMI